MLISIADALARYDVSRSTIVRRLNDGTLTKHHHADTNTIRLDIDELDERYPRRSSDSALSGGSTEPRPAHEVVGVLPRGMADALVPTPAALLAATTRALRPPLFPRLAGRSQR